MDSRLKGCERLPEPLPKYLQYSDGEYAGNMSTGIRYNSNAMGYSAYEPYQWAQDDLIGAYPTRRYGRGSRSTEFGGFG